MTSRVRRAGAFAAVGSLALAAPVLEVVAAAPFAFIAALAVFTIHDGPVFDLFARPGEHREERLYGLIGFTLAASGVVLLATVTEMPYGVGVGTVLLVSYGNLAVQVVRTWYERPILIIIAYAGGGGLAFLAGEAATLALLGDPLRPVVPQLLFLAAAGGFLATLMRAVLTEADDPYVMVSVGLGLWLLSAIVPTISLLQVGIAIGLTVGLGYASYALETASIPGMLTGGFIGLVTIVLGGYAWFAVLITFFGVGGLSTKYRYETKVKHGVAEDNEGARGSGNVLANGAVGLACVIAYAALPRAPEIIGGMRLITTMQVRSVLPAEPTVFLFAFVGSFATAMSDTLSSEIGGVFESPRLITTLEPVDPGTDGGVTWQGELAGIAGATLIAGLALAVFSTLTIAGATLVVLAGVIGMTADSLLGATAEGEIVGNGTVNFLATLTGAVVAAGMAMMVGLA